MTLNRTIAPALHTDTKLAVPPIDSVRLDNGLQVFLVTGGTEDISRIDFVFPAGSLYEKQALTASTTNYMLNEGSTALSAMQWAEMLDYHGAYGIPSASKDSASYTLYSLNRQLKELLPPVRDLLLHPTFPEREMDTYLNKLYQMYLVNRQRTAFLARDRFEEALFGKDHPYGKRILPVHFRELSPELLKAFHRKHYFANSTFAIVSGKIPSKLPEIMNREFGSIRLTPAAVPVAGLPETGSPGQGQYHVPKEDAVQNTVRMGRLLPGRDHPDFPELEILNTVLGGFFGSRLMTSIRQEKGLSYGIHSLLITLKQTACCTIVSELNSEHTDAAVEEIFRQMERLQEEPLSNEEWELVKNYLAAEFLRMFDGPLAQADALRGVLEAGADFSYYKRLAEALRTTKPERLQMLAGKYLHEKDWLVVTAGKSSANPPKGYQ